MKLRIISWKGFRPPCWPPIASRLKISFSSRAVSCESACFSLNIFTSSFSAADTSMIFRIRTMR